MQVLLKPKIEDYRFNVKTARITYHKDLIPNTYETNLINSIENYKSYYQSSFLLENSEPKNIGDAETKSIVLYNPEFPQSFDELVYYHAFLFGNPFEKREEESFELPEVKSILDTSLLDDAQEICLKFRKNWNEFTNKKQETRQKLNIINDENMEIFLNETVPLMAFEMYEMINMLVTTEGMKRSAFPSYEKLWGEIQTCNDTKERAKKARQLCFLLEARIPASIKVKRPMIIAPVINAKALGPNDLEQFKSTNGK